MNADIPKEIVELAEKREKRSIEYEQRYKSGDISALHEFCRLDVFAIKTRWIQEEIQKALMTGNMEVLSGLFATGKRERKNHIAARAQSLIIRDAIDRKAKETGLPKSQPAPATDDAMPGAKTVYDEAYDNMTLTFRDAQKMSPKTLLNHYSKASKYRPDVMIEQTEAGKFVRLGPLLAKVHGESFVGVVEVFYPAEGGDQTIRSIGVFNVPHGDNTIERFKEIFNPTV